MSELWYVYPAPESAEIPNLTEEHHYALTAYLPADAALAPAALPGFSLTSRQILS